MVKAAAKTGREKASKNEVISTDHTNKGIFDHPIIFIFILKIVTIKLIDPRIEEIPAMWSLRIPKSTAGPEWKIPFDKGGYTVHPVPTPLPTTADLINSDKEGGSSQNLMLLSRGYAMSVAPIISGTKRFPNPPIIIGITIKKIIIKAWAVITEL